MMSSFRLYIFLVEAIIFAVHISAFREPSRIPTPTGGLKLMERHNLKLPIYLKVDHYQSSGEGNKDENGRATMSLLSITNVSSSSNEEEPAESFPSIEQHQDHYEKQGPSLKQQHQQYNTSTYTNMKEDERETMVKVTSSSIEIKEAEEKVTFNVDGIPNHNQDEGGTNGKLRSERVIEKIFYYGLGLNFSANTGKKSNCECGMARTVNSVSSTKSQDKKVKPAGKIIGGQAPTIRNEFPWRVSLQREERASSMFCGGSIIDKSWILTSATCLSDLKDQVPIFVNVGDHDLSTLVETDNDVIRVSSWILHPHWNPITNDNDIAVVKLEREIVFRHNIQPLCLPYRFIDTDFTGATVSIAGWTNSNVLMKAQTPYLTTIQCRNLVGIAKVSTISNNVICSLGYDSSICSQDRGSSLDFHDMETKRYFGLGVAISGTCLQSFTPVLYTKLVNYLQFVQIATSKLHK